MIVQLDSAILDAFRIGSFDPLINLLTNDNSLIDYMVNHKFVYYYENMRNPWSLIKPIHETCNYSYGVHKLDFFDQNPVCTQSIFTIVFSC